MVWFTKWRYRHFHHNASSCHHQLALLCYNIVYSSIGQSVNTLHSRFNTNFTHKPIPVSTCQTTILHHLAILKSVKSPRLFKLDIKNYFSF